MSDASAERTAMVVVRIWTGDSDGSFAARVSTTCDAARDSRTVTTVHSEAELRVVVNAWVGDLLERGPLEREPRR